MHPRNCLRREIIGRLIKENEDKETARHSDVDIDKLDGIDVETIAYASDKNDDDDIVDIEIIDVRPLHPRESFKRQQQKRDEYNRKKIIVVMKVLMTTVTMYS